jgi:hypothetical protein
MVSGILRWLLGGDILQGSKKTRRFAFSHWHCVGAVCYETMKQLEVKMRVSRLDRQKNAGEEVDF